jgi:hypothetical protein
MVLEIMRAETENERIRHRAALVDLIEHGDPTLDPTLLDPWAQVYLKRNGLYLWPEPADGTHHQRLEQRRSSVAGDAKVSSYRSDATHGKH